MNQPPVDLVASRSCQLILLDPAGMGLPDGTDLTPYIKSAILPGTATVQIGEHTVIIPEGTTRYVMHESMTYRLVGVSYAKAEVVVLTVDDQEEWDDW